MKNPSERSEIIIPQPVRDTLNIDKAYLLTYNGESEDSICVSLSLNKKLDEKKKPEIFTCLIKIPHKNEGIVSVSDGYFFGAKAIFDALSQLILTRGISSGTDSVSTSVANTDTKSF